MNNWIIYILFLIVFEIYFNDYYLIIKMASVLLRQFTQGRNKSFISQYKKVFGMKTPTVLDKIIPDISGNL